MAAGGFINIKLSFNTEKFQNELFGSLISIPVILKSQDVKNEPALMPVLGFHQIDGNEFCVRFNDASRFYFLGLVVRGVIVQYLPSRVYFLIMRGPELSALIRAALAAAPPEEFVFLHYFKMFDLAVFYSFFYSITLAQALKTVSSQVVSFSKSSEEGPAPYSLTAI